MPGNAVEFRLAAAADDPALRQLLRETPMAGDIRLTLEREPGYFAASSFEGPVHRTIVAVEGNRVIRAGGISARPRYVNSRPMRVGYLGGLRLAAAARNRASIVRRGYDLFRRLHEALGPHLYLTSIVSDNVPAPPFAGAGAAEDADLPLYGRLRHARLASKDGRWLLRPARVNQE